MNNFKLKTECKSIENKKYCLTVHSEVISFLCAHGILVIRDLLVYADNKCL